MKQEKENRQKEVEKLNNIIQEIKQENDRILNENSNLKSSLNQNNKINENENIKKLSNQIKEREEEKKELKRQIMEFNNLSEKMRKLKLKEQDEWAIKAKLDHDNYIKEENIIINITNFNDYEYLEINTK